MNQLVVIAKCSSSGFSPGTLASPPSKNMRVRLTGESTVTVGASV